MPYVTGTTAPETSSVEATAATATALEGAVPSCSGTVAMADPLGLSITRTGWWRIVPHDLVIGKMTSPSDAGELKRSGDTRIRHEGWGRRPPVPRTVPGGRCIAMEVGLSALAGAA